MTPTLDLSTALLKRPSVTPKDEGCQDIIASRLQQIGFVTETLYFGEKDGVGDCAQVQNLWAKRGMSEPVLCFLGHTDVVPVGDVQAWTHPPFDAVVQDNMLYGRGAADMKTAIACFVVACENFIAQHPNHKGSIALLLTSDEEGAAVNGVAKVVQALQARGETITYCVVGEPSSTQVLGDVIKNGRRGSLSGELTITGKQGHVAYPHLAVNPIHHAMAVLAELCATTWDNGNEYFPATSMQVSNIHAGTGANNVIPNTLQASFNFRFSTQSTPDSLMQKTHAILDKYFDNSPAGYHIDWRVSGLPFLTEEGDLVQACRNAIGQVTGVSTQLSTSGGTSDGRFVAPMGAQVVELGVLNATIHQVNECVAVQDLEQLTQIYQKILENLLL